jgi:hypothetical protein
MKWVLMLALMMPLTESAGWWGDFCEKYLIAWDPEPYYTADDATLISEYRREGAKAYWAKEKSSLLKVIGTYMRKRGLDTSDYEAWER